MRPPCSSSTRWIGIERGARQEPQARELRSEEGEQLKGAVEREPLSLQRSPNRVRKAMRQSTREWEDPQDAVEAA
jgi:hypothetical protein